MPTRSHLAAVALCIAVAGTAAEVPAEEPLLVDRGFQTLADRSSPWRLEPDAAGELARVDGFEGPVLHLRDGAVSQVVTLEAGLYEVAAIGRGSGELSLVVSDIGERTQPLGGDRGTYGYLFECPAGRFTVTARVRGEAWLRACAMRPATPDQQAAWRRAQQSMVQFGFATSSPQRPVPGASTPSADTPPMPLRGMSRRAVLDEPRMSTAHVRNEQRLVEWLGSNGFERLDADSLGRWMSETVGDGSAYGSVVVLCRAICPANLLEGPRTEPLWLAYLRAGGRIVHVGDVPFANSEYAAVKPLMSDSVERGLSLLGLDAGWHSPFWGRGDRPVTATRAARDWGFENLDSSITGFPAEAVSLAFGTYTVEKTGRTGASTWFKNVRPDAPWSGLIRMQHSFDGDSDSALRDVWRAALYAGAPVEIPPLPPRRTAEAASVRLHLGAGVIMGRSQVCQGEDVTAVAVPSASLRADAIRFSLRHRGKRLADRSMPVRSGSAVFSFPTMSWAAGDYELGAAAISKGREVGDVRRTVGIRLVHPKDFHWAIWHDAGPNSTRTSMECADIAAAGMDVLLARTTPEDIDAVVGQGLGFSLRLATDLTGGRQPDYASQPQLFRVSPEGKPVSNAFSGERPSLGISHPAVRANAARAIHDAVAMVAAVPAFRPYVLCNDDFSVYYGWDYSQHVLDEFERSTGRRAPRGRPQPPEPGVIPDDDPWLEWFAWTLRNVCAEFNRVETLGATSARPDVRLGPIPGAMQIPLVSLWEPAQYPPYSFGPGGFNLISSYYYNTFWQPVMTTSFWMEVGFMGNRDLEQINMPDAMNTAGYTRNNFYHYLLGGVRGLAYFTYRHRSESAWRELTRLGEIVRRIGPVQAALRPATRDVALLNSLSTSCYEPEHTLSQTFAYHNLMQAHYDVRMTCEEELIRGGPLGARTLVLTGVKWLRRSALEAISAYAAAGTPVIVDASVPLEVPGAHRIDIDLGTGERPPASGRRSPGLADYGSRERVKAVREALDPLVGPGFECADPRLVSARFEAAGVPYTWFVNAHDGEEFTRCRELGGAGHPGARTPEKIEMLVDWEEAQARAGPFEATISEVAPRGVPYDLVAMSRIPVERDGDRSSMTVRMERFGGSLVAWFPAPLRAVAVRTRPPSDGDGEVVFTVSCVAGEGREASDEVPARGVIPYEFDLRDPEGAPHALSSVRVLRDGSDEVRWTPARNDPAGTWTVGVRELASGLTASGTFVVHP